MELGTGHWTDNCPCESRTGSVQVEAGKGKWSVQRQDGLELISGEIKDSWEI